MPSLEMQKAQNPVGGWKSGRMFGYEPAQGWLRCGGLGRGAHSHGLIIRVLDRQGRRPSSHSPGTCSRPA